VGKQVTNLGVNAASLGVLLFILLRDLAQRSDQTKPNLNQTKTNEIQPKANPNQLLPFKETPSKANPNSSNKAKQTQTKANLNPVTKANKSKPNPSNQPTNEGKAYPNQSKLKPFNQPNQSKSRAKCQSQSKRLMGRCLAVMLQGEEREDNGAPRDVGQTDGALGIRPRVYANGCGVGRLGYCGVVGVSCTLR
jgi:hypothetical protein